jgi:hypothetical protein
VGHSMTLVARGGEFTRIVPQDLAAPASFVPES